MNINQNISQILDLYRERSGNIKECFYISAKIKEESERNIADRFDSTEIIGELIDDRDGFIQKIKNIDATIHHYALNLTDTEKKILKEVREAVRNGQHPIAHSLDYVWAGELYNILSNDKNIIEKIELADDVNFIIIKDLLEEIKIKIKSIKGNRLLMNKFVDDTSAVSLGTLIKEKK